jgi:lysophospholipase L1-like esterase
MRPAGWMRARVAVTLLSATAVVVVVTSGWTINEVGKNNRAIFNMTGRTQETADAIAALTRKVDRLRPLTVGHEHSDVRQFMIRAHLAHAVSPVVVFGDSITEAAVLPGAICGHAVVNAGIGGAGVDELLKDAPLLLEGKSPALVVLAIGTNDAYATSGREQQFRQAYTALLHRLALLAPKLVVANIPPVDPKGPLTAAIGIDASLIERYNLILPKLAEDAGALFIDLNKAVSAEGATETIDGVHLAPGAYSLWDAAMLAGVKSALNCSASSLTDLSTSTNRSSAAPFQPPACRVRAECED